VSVMRRTWKVRDLRAFIRGFGCEPKRMTGSHEIWSLPDGRSLPPFVGTRDGALVSPIVLASIRRFFMQAGISIEL
jgi:hypothetical protein